MFRPFWKKIRSSAEIHEISGSVEIAPGIGLADAIVDLVSSGSTLFMNGLKEVETILQSEAVLIQSSKAEFREERKFWKNLLFQNPLGKKSPAHEIYPVECAQR